MMTTVSTLLLVGAALVAGAAWLLEAHALQRRERGLIPVPVDRERPRHRS